MREFIKHDGSADELGRLTHEGKGHGLALKKAGKRLMTSIKDGITNAERTDLAGMLLSTQQGVPRFHEIMTCPGCPTIDRRVKTGASSASELDLIRVKSFVARHECRNPRFQCRTHTRAVQWLASLTAAGRTRKVAVG